MLRQVAPYVGAWIETTFTILSSAAATSHPTWVRGLKLISAPAAKNFVLGRTLRGCVD